MKSIAYAVALAGLIGLTGPAAARAQGIAVGEVPDAPVLETLDGETADLGEVIGTKPVLVEFWATWCPICRALEPRLLEAEDTYGDRVEFVVVAVAVSQDQADVRRHMDRRPLPGRVLWDARGRAARAFEAAGTGFIVILDETGTVTYTGTGTDQDLMGALERVVGGE